MLYGYEPMRAGLNAAYKFNVSKYSLSILTGVLWANWASYINRHGETPRDEWSNTAFSFSAGALASNKGRDIALDTTYVMSPVPDQTGRENYIDNDNNYYRKDK